MTIKEFANSLSISPQAVYKRLKGAGIALDSIRQENSSELTDEGLKQLETLFENTVEKTVNESTIEPVELTALKVENEFLKQRIADLTADRDRWAALAEAAQQTAQQAQALNMANLKALPAPRRSLWDVITGKKA